MVQGPFTEAARFCGCDPKDVCVGAMGGIQEPDKDTTIFHASIIGVNDNIRANTDKKTIGSTLYDLLTARLLDPGPLTLFKSDVSKAHRRIKVQQTDWKYMIATIKDKFWVNMVGTYMGWPPPSSTGAAWLQYSPACLTTSRLTYFGFWSLWMTSWLSWYRTWRNQQQECSCSSSLSWDAQFRGTRTFFTL